MTEHFFAIYPDDVVLGIPTAAQVTFSPAGGLAADDVQEALEELDAEKLAEVAEDTTPVLGGNLDGDGNTITGISALGITGTDGIDFSPGSDTDVDLFTVGVTGSPKLWWDESANAFQIEPHLVMGDPGAEGAGLTILGSTYQAVGKVSDIGGLNAAQFILHRHSTTLASVLIGTRSNSDDNSHLAVTDNDVIFSIYGAAVDADGEDYNLAGLISFVVDGTPGSGDLPGEIQFWTNTGGASLTKQMVIRADGSVEFTSETITGNSKQVLVNGTTQSLTAGYSATDYNAGTQSSGTFTPDEANGNFQYAVNGGAHTLAPPSNTCSIVVQYTNNGSAGAVTTSGFTQVTGDTISTTNGDDFFMYITVNNSFSHLNVVALQ